MSGQRAANRIKLPFLTDQHFADETQNLLAEYGNKFQPILAPPVPIDEIVELYLELKLEFMDMKKEFKVDDVHGALWVNERRVGIDESLDPDRNPAKLGRYHFTLAHEAGHWRLHRRHFQKRAANQLALLAGDSDRPEYICRSSDRDPIEIQADMFAAALLMPESFVRRIWHEQTGSGEPTSIDELRAQATPAMKSDAERRMQFQSGSDAENQAMMESAAKPLAEIFEVSPIAMRNRLQKLNLFVKTKPSMLF
jgi:Zn-dependent peptidase ImmA (M78 family)